MKPKRTSSQTSVTGTPSSFLGPGRLFPEKPEPRNPNMGHSAAPQNPGATYVPRSSLISHVTLSHTQGTETKWGQAFQYVAPTESRF